jgi:hypothetical protein
VSSIQYLICSYVQYLVKLGQEGGEGGAEGLLVAREQLVVGLSEKEGDREIREGHLVRET